MLLVEAVGRYSNDPDVLRRLHRTRMLRPNRAGGPTPWTPRVHAVERRLDDATRLELIAAYVAGSPTTALMERYGLGKGTVLGVLHRAGVALRNQGLGDDDLPQAVTLYESGLSLKRVAEQMSCDAETVRQALKTAGVRVRSPWERPVVSSRRL